MLLMIVEEIRGLWQILAVMVMTMLGNGRVMIVGPYEPIIRFMSMIIAIENLVD